jgi:hypothetical protein
MIASSVRCAPGFECGADWERSLPWWLLMKLPEPRGIDCNQWNDYDLCGWELGTDPSWHSLEAQP